MPWQESCAMDQRIGFINDHLSELWTMTELCERYEISRKTGGDPVTVLKRAVENVRPQLEVKSRRVGGATYQVPVEVRPRRATTLAIRWIVGYCRQRREKTMAERLAGELLDASNGIGASIKRREDLQKMAESNKAFAHYRW